MPKTMLVVATKDPVPREESGRRYITAKDPVEIELSSYYRRRLADGEIKEAAGKAAPKGEK